MQRKVRVFYCVLSSWAAQLHHVLRARITLYFLFGGKKKVTKKKPLLSIRIPLRSVGARRGTKDVPALLSLPHPSDGVMSVIAGSERSE
jgi:hypothetical protein